MEGTDSLGSGRGGRQHSEKPLMRLLAKRDAYQSPVADEQLVAMQLQIGAGNVDTV